MDFELLRGFLRLGIFIGGCSLVMVFLQPRDSPEFIVSLCSMSSGLFLIIGVMLIMRWTQRRL